MAAMYLEHGSSVAISAKFVLGPNPEKDWELGQQQTWSQRSIYGEFVAIKAN